eukprot:307316-Amphidinium_carterae.1
MLGLYNSQPDAVWDACAVTCRAMLSICPLIHLFDLIVTMPILRSQRFGYTRGRTACVSNTLYSFYSS